MNTIFSMDIKYCIHAEKRSIKYSYKKITYIAPNSSETEVKGTPVQQVSLSQFQLSTDLLICQGAMVDRQGCKGICFSVMAEFSKMFN